MIEIMKLASITDSSEYQSTLEQIKAIFFVSSSLKEFSSEERKAAFFKRWCGDYISLYPEQFFIMKEGEKVLGYLSGCNDSTAAISILEIPGFNGFSDLFENYPAHFHINFHPDCRGRGLGSELVETYCKYLSERQIKGVHLVTSLGAANIPFYQRLNFTHEVERPLNQMTLVFMGRVLD